MVSGTDVLYGTRDMMGKHDTVGAVVVPSPPALRFCYAVSFTDVYYGLMRLLCHVWYWHMVTRICYAMS
eukprot:1272055-Rhodomonas_salina.3